VTVSRTQFKNVGRQLGFVIYLLNYLHIITPYHRQSVCKQVNKCGGCTFLYSGIQLQVLSVLCTI